MAHKFNPKHKDKLDTKQRRRDLPPEKILEKFNLQTNDTVADVGCGVGYFTIPMAQISDEKVYAFDLSQEMLDEVAVKREEHELHHIKLINTTQEEDYIPDKKIDFMLMSNLIHEVEDKEEFLSNYLRGVKNGGRIAIIDFKKEKIKQGPPLSEKVSKAELYKLLEDKLALKLELVADLNEYQYAIVAKK
ncbi:class I SAM-dependent methyltransferase [Halanaerobacter jeridensis]|uniref:Ubiquinone/menaquinone biosynthesis C-methylase UbiE n=1 Tax=Halanaerobacter jeridensis TaxID=706427 RepID=A0A939BMT0_9FIRM|nr:class I SAM-dependent methyltransferase [Halanaerobacter jeridensis]MBM7557390.1 ubiquinone/menaquinone biosynthesis C-methylase UbiE [Halanaerobacter jeridensis]